MAKLLVGCACVTVAYWQGDTSFDWWCCLSGTVWHGADITWHNCQHTNTVAQRVCSAMNRHTAVCCTTPSEAFVGCQSLLMPSLTRIPTALWACSPFCSRFRPQIFFELYAWHSLSTAVVNCSYYCTVRKKTVNTLMESSRKMQFIEVVWDLCVRENQLITTAMCALAARHGSHWRIAVLWGDVPPKHQHIIMSCRGEESATSPVNGHGYVGRRVKQKSGNYWCRGCNS